MKNKLCLALLIAALAPAPALPYTNAELKRLYYQSTGEKDPEARRRLQLKIADAAPDSAYGMMCDGAVLIAEGRMEPLIAVKLYSKVIKLDPAIAAAHNNLGLAYSQLNRCTHALTNFGKALELDPAYANAYANRGYCHKQLGDDAAALLDYNKSLALKPGDYITLLNRGLLHYDLRKFRKAAADFTGVIRLKPDYAEAYAYRCEAYKALGEEGKAGEDCARAEKLRGNGN